MKEIINIKKAEEGKEGSFSEKTLYIINNVNIENIQT